MGYISKELLQKAYKELSSLTEDHLQGQTQIVSMLRYLFAFDMFCKKNKTGECDLNISKNKKDFVQYVSRIVNIYNDYYTTNFYTTIKPSSDCGVGSNFFSAGVVNNSRQNKRDVYDYPTRGQNPLFKVKANVLIRDFDYYNNINYYLNTDALKQAFAIWLLRNDDIVSLDEKIIKNTLVGIFSKELIDKLLSYKADLKNFTKGFSLVKNQPNLTNDDFLNLFVSPPKEAKNTLSTQKAYRPFLTAIQTKPFLLLAGISGTGKSRIVREFAFKSCPKYLQDKDGTTPGNYCMIEVKPNWHDSTELLGYYSRLGSKPGYQFTKFVKFLVKAKMYPDVPFFVCLDEMNLAPVEQYFAEILSILETRKVVIGEDGNMTIKTEAIIDAEHFKALGNIGGFAPNFTDRDIYMKLYDIDTEIDINEAVGKRTDLKTEGLTIPDNVVIIGTVNMDDTTHQFSRKVIDRAMTIEMNGGNLRDMFGGSKNLEYLPDEEQEKWQYAFTRRYVTADEVIDAHSDVAEELVKELPAKLEKINKALRGTPFEVSYRVLNELTIMVGVMLDQNDGKKLDNIIGQALNNILLMKILPRIEGDAEMFALSREYKNKVGVSYDNRLEWLKDLAPDINGTSSEGTSENGDAEESADTSTEHHQTAKEKIQEMIDRLNNQEFTRFWP